MKQLDKIRRNIRECFSVRLHAALEQRFPGLKVETEWNLISMNLETRPTSAKKFTKEQYVYIEAFSAGYADAKEQVRGS